MEPWLGHTVRRRSEQAYEVAAVRVVDESTNRLRGVARARRCMPCKPEPAGTQLCFNITHYNHSIGSVWRHDAGEALWLQLHAEDVLR